MWTPRSSPLHKAGCFSGFVTVWSVWHPVEDENRGDAIAKNLEVGLPLWPFDDTVLCAS